MLAPTSAKEANSLAYITLDSFRHPYQHVLSRSPTAEQVAHESFVVTAHNRFFKNNVWYNQVQYANGTICVYPCHPNEIMHKVSEHVLCSERPPVR